MRIVTYNLRHGGSGKGHWAKVIEQFNPDLFLVQESYPPDAHLPPMLYPGLGSGAVWQSVGGRKWGSAIWAKQASLRQIEVPGFAGNVVGAAISRFPWTDGGNLVAFSIHAPAFGGYQKAVHAILDEISKLHDGCDLVIGGDFNLSVSERHHSESKKTSAADLAIQARIQNEFALVNCWQLANPDVPLAQTLRWINDRGATPYHCDGIFVPTSWASRLRSCEVHSGAEWNALSDHNPVEA